MKIQDTSFKMTKRRFRFRGQKIEKTHFGWAFVRIRAKIEKNALCGKTLVRVRAKIEKKTFFGNFWLE